MEAQDIFLIIITGLGFVICYFIKKVYSKTEQISLDISDMKPKVDILWKSLKN